MRTAGYKFVYFAKSLLSLQMGSENTTGLCCSVLLLGTLGYFSVVVVVKVPPPSTPPVAPFQDLQTAGHPLVQTLGKSGEIRHIPLRSPGSFVLLLPHPSLPPAPAAGAPALQGGGLHPLGPEVSESRRTPQFRFPKSSSPLIPQLPAF